MPDPHRQHSTCRCIVCGAPIVDVPNGTRYCPACRSHKVPSATEGARGYRSQGGPGAKEDRSRDIARRAEKKADKSSRAIARVNAAAEARGMSYGQYVAWPRTHKED